MKCTLKISMLLVLVTLFVNPGQAVFAQGKKEKKEETRDVVFEKKESSPEKEHKFAGIRNLSGDQEQKIEKIKFPHKKEMMLMKNLLAEKKAHLKTLETTDNADMNAINKTIEEIGAIKTDMMKKKAAHEQEIRKILNEEQRLQYDLRHMNKKMQGKKNKKIHREMMMEHPGGMETEKEIRIIKETDEEE